MYPLAFLIFIFPACLLAKGLDETNSYTWPDILKLLSRNNPELAAQKAAIRASEKQLKIAQSAHLPNLTSGLDYSRNNESFASLSQSTAEDRYSAYLSLRQSIFAGFSDYYQIQMAKTDLEMTKLNLTQLKLRLVSDAMNAYSQLVYAQSSEQLQDKIVERRSENLDIVTLRFENGRENKGSVLQSQAYLESAKFERRQSEQNILLYKSQLLSLILGLGQQQNTIDTLKVSGSIPRNQTPNSASSAYFKDTALHHPNVSLSKLSKQLAQYQISGKKSRFLPSIETRAQYNLADESLTLKRSSWSISIGLSYPIYSGGADLADVLKAESLYQQADLNQEFVIRKQIDQLQETFYRYQQTTEQLGIERLFEKAAITRAEIARSKYNNGLMSFEEWDRIESELINRQKSVLRLKRDLAITYADWIAAQGKELI